jgi:hypothetical protein
MSSEEKGVKSSVAGVLGKIQTQTPGTGVKS